MILRTANISSEKERGENYKLEEGAVPNGLNTECKHCGACNCVGIQSKHLLPLGLERKMCCSYILPVALQPIPVPGTAHMVFLEHKRS